MELVPFKNNIDELYLITVFANEDQYLELKLYKFNYPNSYGDDLLELNTVIIQKEFKQDSNNNELVMSKRVSCEITYSSEYEHEALTCFLMNDQSLFLVINFYPENITVMSFSKNQIKTTGNIIIVSAVSSDKKKCISCYIDFKKDFFCSLYDVETNILSEPVILMNNCMQIEYGADIQYISEKKEYVGHCILTLSKKSIIKLDENFEVKEGVGENNSKYYISVSTQSGVCYNVYSMSVLYIKSSQDYFIARTCDINNVPTLDLISISEENIVKYEIPGDTKSESTSTFNTKTTFQTPKSTIFSNTHIKSTIPTLKSSLISSIQMESVITFIGTYELSSFKYYYENDNIICPENKPYELIRMKECITECSITDFFNEICRPNYNYLNAKEDIIKNIINKIKNDKANLFISSIKYDKLDLLVRNDDILYQVTSFENQKNNKYDEISTTNFNSLCEKLLKEKYNIPENETIIILKIEYSIPGLYVPIIEYKVFHPISNIELDLNHCINNNYNEVNISFIVNIDENNLYKHEPNGIYYNDICEINLNKENVDLTIYGRKKEFNKKNLSLCEKDCLYQNYDKNTKKVLCQCNLKTKFSFLSELNKTKYELLNNFVNIKSVMNLIVVKCYYLLFNKDGLTNNIGSYTILIIVFIYILGIILFLIKGYPYLEMQIKEIIKIKKEMDNNKNLNDISKRRRIKGRKRKLVKIGKNKNKSINSINKNVNSNNFDSQNQKINSKINLNLQDNKDLFIKNKVINDITSKKIYRIPNQENSKNNILKFTDSEINGLNYDTALKIDKRTYIQYYLSLLKTKHLLIFTFYPMKDHNSMIIKICLFFFSF